MRVQPAINDFGGQIDRVNVQRCAAGLRPLDRERAVREITRLWNMMLRDAKARLQEKARRDLGHDLADNSFTHLILVREIEPDFRATVAAMVQQP